jgi:hypothetical protein
MTFSLLFDRDGPRIGLNDGVEAAPPLESLDAEIARLRAAQDELRKIPIDDLLGLCDAAARQWTQPGHPVADVIRGLRLGFLPLWLRRANLQAMARRSLRGCPGALDGFVPLADGDPLFVRAQPRGIVVHWVAGNVPVLGFLSVVQAMLCKNANVVKVSRRAAGVLPHLFAALSEVSCTTAAGETLTGRVLTDAAAVVYADRNDREAAIALSHHADVRTAWGGREAVEAIVNLPRRHETEDIVFGPKLSFAVVGAERLGDGDTARRTAAALAGDACAFDQQGCNSPHTVFVERGGAISPAAFARLLGEAMAAESRRAPLGDVDPAMAMNVLGIRTEYAMRGEVHSSREIHWAVLYDETDKGLAEPCYLRTLFVRPVDDVFEAAAHCSAQTQTAGLAVDRRRHALAEALTARGVERCPAVGAMRIYDVPWDGLFAMDRMVRWVSG